MQDKKAQIGAGVLRRLLEPAPLTIIIAFFTCTLYLSDYLTPVRNAIVDSIFTMKTRVASEEVVVVAIDSKSLQTFGIWPWPRSIVAQVISNISDSGATKIAIDIDYSAESTPEQDIFLRDSIANAGSIIVMPIFRQLADNTASDEGQAQRFIDTYPLRIFLPHIGLGSANILLGDDGLVRRYNVFQDFDGNVVPALATALLDEPPDSGTQPTIGIDYSIDPSTIPVISLSDVLLGNYDPAVFAGKNVIIGATALELGDISSVPVYRALPGPVIIAMAYETMTQDRSLQNASPGIVIGLTLLLCFGFTWIFERTGSGKGILAWLMGLVFMFALSAALQTYLTYVFDISVFLLATTLIYFASLVRNLELQAVHLLFQSMEIRRTGTLMRTVVENSNDAIIVFSVDGKVLDANPAGLALFGYSEDEMKEIPFSDLFMDRQLAEQPQSFPDFLRAVEELDDCQGKRKDASPFTLDVNHSSFEVDGEKRYAAFLRDVTVQRRQAQMLEYQAFHDGLTGLPNRELLTRRLDELLDDTSGPKPYFALLLMDLDRFKEVNDTLGHNIGDELLQEVAIRLTQLMDDADTVARLGGDEFAFLITSARTPSAVEDVAKSITTMLQKPIELMEVTIAVEASIGISVYPDHGQSIKQLFQCSDIAMYTAKNDKMDYWFYDKAEDTNSLRQLVLAGDLRTAIDKGELFLYYQPRIELATNTVEGFEALMRWDHSEYGIVPAQEFIDIAEQSGIIHALTRFALEQAIIQSREWMTDGYEFVVGVNLSTRNLQDKDLLDTILQLLEKHDLPRNRIMLEVTESSVMNRQDTALKTLDSLSEAGFCLAIDDFGTGYSSLQYVKDLPVNELKIDKSFVFDMQRDDQSRSIVEAIITLAKALDLHIVAEGVENEEIVSELRDMGCTYAQGYHFSRPMPAGDVTTWLQNRNIEKSVAKPSDAIVVTQVG